MVLALPNDSSSGLAREGEERERKTGDGRERRQEMGGREQGTEEGDRERGEREA